MTSRLLVVGLAAVVAVGLLPAFPAVPAHAVESASLAQADRSVPVEQWRADPVVETAMEDWAAPDLAWPSAAVEVVELPTDGHSGRLAASAVVGGLPVRLAPVSFGEEQGGLDPDRVQWFLTQDAPSRVQVEVLDRGAADGAAGPLVLRIKRVDGSSAHARLRVVVDYSAFRQGFGGDWADRLRLVGLPECALTAVAAEDNAVGEPCEGVRLLATQPNFAAGTVAAEVELTVRAPAALSGSGLNVEALGEPAAGVGAPEALVGLMSGPSGEGGDFTKTDLKASYSWTHGGASGHFAWSYPIEVPQVPGGLVPSVSLDYNSGAVDGQTAGQNVQPSWVGEGWNYEPSYVERTYRPCFDDSANSPHWTSLNDKTVLCWRLPNAQVVLNGKATEIVRGNDGTWRLADDDGEKVELLTGASNRDDNGEHWKITTIDGTQYWFGRHFLPNGRGETFSTAEVRVYANHSGEPCFSTSAIGSTRCDQAYRWMLDYVVDVHGNEISFWYNSETNRAKDTGTGSYQYRRAIRPIRIEYGSRVGDDPATPAPARIVFTAGDRCLQDCHLTGGDPRVENWPDTPWDLQCAASPCLNNVSPSFFTSKRLTQIRAEVRDGGQWRVVDQYDLTHTFPSTGTALTPALWLSGITRTAHGADGSTEVFPAVTFTGERRSQRADFDPNASMADPRKWRVVGINTETGGRIEVVYFGPQDGCVFGSSFPSPHNNSRRCFPRLYTNSFQQTGWSWWHLFTVQQIIEKDLVGGSPDVVHAFGYSSAGSSSTVKWAHDDGAAVWGQSIAFRSWSQWRGWSQVTVRSGTAAQGTRSMVETLYFRGLDGDRADAGGATRSVELTDVHGSTFVDHPNRVGRALQTITYNASGGSPVHATRHQQIRSLTGTRTLSSDWAIPSVQRSYISRDSFHEEWDFNPDTGLWDRFERVRYRWDDTNGRLDSISDSHRGTCTRLEYAQNTSKHLLDRISRETTNRFTCDTAPGTLFADTRHFYDGIATHGATPTLGNRTKTELLGDSGWFTQSVTGYDQYGRVTSSADGLGRTTTTTYTHSSGRRLNGLSVTNAANQTTTSVIEPQRGLPLSITDPNNHTTTGAYDPAGRLVKMWAAGHDTTGTPTAEYEYSINKSSPTWVSSKVLGPNGNQIVSYEIYDGMLRLRQQQDTAPDGKRVITDTTYNHRGQEAKLSTFYNNASGPAPTLVTFNDANIDRQTRHVYDGRGRQTETQRWSQGAMLFKTTTAYGHRNVLTTPPAGGTLTRQIFDGRDNVTAERRYHTSNPNGTYDETTFTYDRLDRLIQATDPASNTWTYQYDLAGRLISTTDPDTGTTSSVLDAAGQHTTITDARGVTLAYAYDQLGRQTALHDSSLAGAKLAEWTYDTVALGQLSSATRYHDGLAYTSTVTGYDPGYRPLGIQIDIPQSSANSQLAGTYLEEMTYHPDGSLATHALPAAGGQPAETITYTYTAAGLPATTTGLDDYITNTIYRWDGSIAETWHGQQGKQVRQSHAYDEPTGRLAATQVDTENQTTPGTYLERFATTYSYDHAGNLRTAAGRTDGLLDQVECFDYDHLRRLTRAWTQATDGCVTPQATGADPYHRSWTFDNTGNRLTQTDHDPIAGNTTWTYLVGATHSVTPHQVAGVTATGPKAATTQRDFTYDAAGNMTTRTTETGATQTLQWDLEGNLAAVTEATDTTSYLYNPDGKQLITREPDKTTLYLGTIHIEEHTGGALIGTRYYGDIALRSATGLHWSISDRADTAIIQIDADTLQPQRRRTMPYGEARGTQPTWLGSKGYVGGTHDGTGLTHIGARAYDPTLGRFISIDPLMNLDDTTQWHGYSYANNNPLTLTDPDGLMPMCIDWCGSPADKTVQAHEAKQQQKSSTPGNKSKASGNGNGSGNGPSNAGIPDAVKKAAGGGSEAVGAGTGTAQKANESRKGASEGLRQGNKKASAQMNWLKKLKREHPLAHRLYTLLANVGGNTWIRGISWAALTAGFILTTIYYFDQGDTIQTALLKAIIVTGFAAGFARLGAAAGTLCGKAAPACVPVFSVAGGLIGARLGEAFVGGLDRTPLFRWTDRAFCRWSQSRIVCGG